MKFYMVFLLSIALSIRCLAEEEIIPSDVAWDFAFDPKDSTSVDALNSLQWRSVSVPHTWQVENGNEDYYGIAWYRRISLLCKIERSI